MRMRQLEDQVREIVATIEAGEYDGPAPTDPSASGGQAQQGSLDEMKEGESRRVETCNSYFNGYFPDGSTGIMPDGVVGTLTKTDTTNWRFESEDGAFKSGGGAEPSRGFKPTKQPIDLSRVDHDATASKIVKAPQDVPSVRDEFKKAQKITDNRVRNWETKQLVDYCDKLGIDPVMKPANQNGQQGQQGQQGQGSGQGQGQGQQGDGQGQQGQVDMSQLPPELLRDQMAIAALKALMQVPSDDKIRQLAAEVDGAMVGLEKRKTDHGEFQPPATTEDFGQAIYTIASSLDEEVAAEVTKYVDHVKAELEKLIDQKVDAEIPKRVEIQINEAPAVEIDGAVHPAFYEVLMLAQLRKPVLLIGPAGSGKSYIGRQLATVLDLAFDKASCTVGMSEGVLGGRLLPIGAGGKFDYITSGFVKAYEEGGVFLLDEVDAADPNVLLMLNDALANGHMSVPNRYEKPYAERHPDFVLIACANTFGTGADRMYVGRNQLDEAFLDRFRMGQIEMDYDPKLEKALCPHDDLRKRCYAIREKARTNRLQRVVSMRALKDAYDVVVRGGQSIEYAIEQVVKGWAPDERQKVGLPKDAPKQSLFKVPTPPAKPVEKPAEEKPKKNRDARRAELVEAMAEPIVIDEAIADIKVAQPA